MGNKRLKIDLLEYESMKKTIEEFKTGKIECKVYGRYYVDREFLTIEDALIKATELNESLREVIKQQDIDLKDIINKKKTKRSFWTKWY